MVALVLQYLLSAVHLLSDLPQVSAALVLPLLPLARSSPPPQAPRLLTLVADFLVAERLCYDLLELLLALLRVLLRLVEA